MNLRLGVLVGIACLIGFLPMAVYSLTEEGGISETIILKDPETTAQKAEEKPQENKVYCESGQQILITVNPKADKSGIEFKKYASFADKAYVDQPVSAKTCTVTVCPSSMDGVRTSSTGGEGIATYSGYSGALKSSNVRTTLPPGIEKQPKDTCSSTKGSTDKRGCYMKCLTHGDSVSDTELKGSAQAGFSQNAQSLTDMLGESRQSNPNGVSGAKREEMLARAKADTAWGASLFPAADEQTKAAITKNAATNGQLIGQLGDVGLFNSGTALKGDKALFENQLAQRLPIPSASDAVSIGGSTSGSGQSPFDNIQTVQPGDFVAANCGGKPCLVEKNAANPGMQYTGSPMSNTFTQVPPGGQKDPPKGGDVPNVPGGGGGGSGYPGPGGSGNSSGGMGGGATAFLSGLARGVMQGLGLGQSPAQQAAQQQQAHNLNYCKQQLGSNAQYISSSNSCTCPSNAPLIKGKCTVLTVAADLTCAQSVVDVGAPLLMNWSCGNATSATGEGFATGNKTSGSLRQVVNFAGKEQKTFALSCLGGKNKKTDSCTVTANHPWLGLVSQVASESSGKHLRLGWSSAGTSVCTLLSPDNSRIAGSAGQETVGIGGGRKIPVEALSQEETRVVLKCETQGKNTIVAGFVIFRSSLTIRAVEQELIFAPQGGDSTTGIYDSSQSNTLGGGGSDIQCDPDEDPGVFSTCFLDI